MDSTNIRLPVTGVVPVEQMAGEDADETAMFQLAVRAAQKYLGAFPWCRQVLGSYFGDGIGGVIEVFFFHIEPAREGVDEWLWVLVGDLPPAYLVIDNCKTPSEALEGYIQQMTRWVELAKRGTKSPDVIRVCAKLTSEEAAALEKRLDFLKRYALPRFRDAETERA